MLDLFFIKFKNSGSGSTEVHAVTGSSNYATFSTHEATESRTDDAPNGPWSINNGDVYFVKIHNTDSGTIEVHRLPKSGSYQKWNLHTTTGYNKKDADNGVWTICNGDLYFLKTKNCDSGTLELHRANHSGNNWPVEGHNTSIFIPGAADNGTVTYRNGKIYLIKTRDTETGKVEVITADGSNYDNITRYETWFNCKDDKNGVWQIDNNTGDLYFIKTHNVDSGKIEVHIATAGNKYKSVSHFVTAYDKSDGDNGYFCV